MEALLLVVLLVYVFVIGFWAVRRVDRFFNQNQPNDAAQAAGRKPARTGPPSAHTNSLHP